MEQPPNNPMIERVQATNEIVAAYKIGALKVHTLLREYVLIKDNTQPPELIDILLHEPIDPQILSALKNAAAEALSPLSERQHADAIAKSADI